eukprot:366529-Chlamydomonas_euryale.AAC.13
MAYHREMGRQSQEEVGTGLAFRVPDRLVALAGREWHPLALTAFRVPDRLISLYSGPILAPNGIHWP